ncbi:MAG TPA: tetratricopeptide repeat protein [Alphaproteobacteria bacterium]|nr:tetratricopeptide repeat protein [Alphaproteobacteria bacterium]
MFNILPFKKSLSFASIVVLASMSMGWQARAMEEGDEISNGRGSPIVEKSVGEGQKEDPEVLNQLGLEYRRKGIYPIARTYFKKAAKLGLPEAHHNLGAMYLNGEGVIRNGNKALKQFQKAAALDFSPSYHNIGMMFRDGMGVPQNDLEALNSFKKAAGLGLHESQVLFIEMLYYMGKKRYEEKDFAGALSWYEDKGLENFAPAQFSIGIIRLSRDSGLQDYLKAIKPLEKAADLGMAEAQYTLGKLYSEGWEGSPPNFEEALKRYQEAAHQNHAQAQEALSEAQYDVAVEHTENQRFSEALKFFRLAAKKNFPRAWFNIGIILRDGCAGKKNGGQALRAFELAIKYGMSEEDEVVIASQYSIAMMYLEGDGIPKSELKAFEWFEKASEKGHEDAREQLGVIQYNIGVKHLIGDGIPRDAVEGLKWLKKAEKNGVLEAKNTIARTQYNIGVTYLHGEGVPQNDTKALKRFKKAAALGHLEAQNAIKMLE